MDLLIKALQTDFFFSFLQKEKAVTNIVVNLMFLSFTRNGKDKSIKQHIFPSDSWYSTATGRKYILYILYAESFHLQTPDMWIMLVHKFFRTVSSVMQITMTFGVPDTISFDFRRWILESKLASSDVPTEERINLIKDLERKETEYMRLKRHKICVNDFELLTIIGRGAYGEVRTISFICICVIFLLDTQFYPCVLLRSRQFFASLLWQLFQSIFSANLLIYRLDYVGRRNLETSMPWKSWRKLKCSREARSNL